MTTFRTAGVYHPGTDAPDGGTRPRGSAGVPVSDVQAQANRMHVRMLLMEKQPDFAALLESVVRESTPEYLARRIGRCPGSGQGPSRTTSGNPVKSSLRASHSARCAATPGWRCAASAPAGTKST
jgi:hypothetical protein